MTQCLVIGNGGREHALAWKLAKSPNVTQVFISPGNGSPFPTADIDVNSSASVIEFCKENGVELIIVGPEAHLSRGIVDEIEQSIPIFGPSKAASMLETSKIFAKHFMNDYNLPTAEFKEFSNISDIGEFISKCSWDGIVVKADGLAAGKGVVVAENKEQALSAAVSMLNGEFGDSGKRLVLEECLQGYELSALAFVDGQNFSRMPLIRDHKRLLEGDRGPNTGGMGVVGPVLVPPGIDQKIDEIIRKSIDGLIDRGIIYKGVLYVGLMVTSTGPKLLEYNCRFGDPETQILMRLLKSDLYEICMSCIKGKITSIEWIQKNVCGVVLSSANYPISGDKGNEITNIPQSSDSVVTFHAGTAYANDKLVTNGGRILCVTALGASSSAARQSAVSVCEQIQYQGKFFRRDIGKKYENLITDGFLSYSDSGVDINEGNQFVENIKNYVQRTMLPGMNQIGGFGAVVELTKCGFQGNVELVLGIDGVGTKIEIADALNDYRNIGYDVVGMCVNDVLCHGAVPLAFLDYYVCGRLRKEQAQTVVYSISEACREAGCSLVGGETAEMPGVYGPKQWDLAGCALAARQAEWPLLPLYNTIESGDVVIGLSSNGLHSNGFSLVRKVFQANGVSYDAFTPWIDKTYGEELLAPTKLYVKQLLPLIKAGKMKGCAHITGGGIVENAIRILDKKSPYAFEIDVSSWDKPPIFNWLASMGPVSDFEMLRTFNCGIGMVLVVSKIDLKHVLEMLESAGEFPKVIGKIIQRKDEDKIKLINMEQAFTRFAVQKQRKVRVGILISGTGTNMINLIENSKRPGSKTEIVMVISNKAEAKGIKKAESFGIRTAIVPHTKIREEGDRVISQILSDAGVEFICLAGYMRLLSSDFVKKWMNRIINIHPSLLPSFKGAHAVTDALDFGAKITGCTVHFVDEELDHGPVIAQAAVNIEELETEESLHKKIQQKEYELFPKAMELIAGKILAGTI